MAGGIDVWSDDGGDELAKPNDLRTLVKRCLAGDQGSMLALVERFQGQVFGLCYRMLGQRQDAEDAAQETFVRVLKNLHRWDQGRDFQPWLLAIAGNRCRTALAARRRRPTPEPAVELIADDAPDERPAAATGRRGAFGACRAASRIPPGVRFVP